MGITLDALALGADGEHARGEFLDAFLGGLARLLPGGAAELAERGRLAADADVTADEVRLGHGHEEPGPLGIMQREHLLGASASGALLQAAVAGDAVLAMHDDVARAQLAHDVARFAEQFGIVELRSAHAAHLLVPAEDLRAAEHGELCPRHGEAAVEQAEQESGMGFQPVAGGPGILPGFFRGGQNARFT